MKAVTIRDTLNNLICFGPDNGMYDPGVPDGMTKQVEDDYEAIKLEYIANLPPQQTKEEIEQATAKRLLLALLDDPEITTKLKSVTTK